MRKLLFLFVLLFSIRAVAQTTQPAPRPSPDKVVGWFNHGAESQTPFRNVGFINGPPQGYTNSIIDQLLQKFVAAGWTRAAMRCPWGTSKDNLIRFEQPLDAQDQGFNWLGTTYASMKQRALKVGLKEFIDYVGSPETLVSRTSDPLYARSLDMLADKVTAQCGPSIAFDNSSGTTIGSFSQHEFEKLDLAGVKVYLEAVPSQSCPHLWHRPFFIQESFQETVEAQQAAGHQADWAATRSELTGERICILDQPPPGADWNNLASPAWRAAINKILARGDTVAVDPGVILAQYPNN